MSLTNCKAAEPKVMEFDQEVCTMEGKQVTLRVAFSGIPKPNLSWTFNGSKVEGDYTIEVGTDGSLLFVCVEKKHSGRYNGSVAVGQYHYLGRIDQHMYIVPLAIVC